MVKGKEIAGMVTDGCGSEGRREGEDLDCDGKQDEDGERMGAMGRNHKGEK